jgi:hypothetical protein
LSKDAGVESDAAYSGRRGGGYAELRTLDALDPGEARRG